MLEDRQNIYGFKQNFKAAPKIPNSQYTCLIESALFECEQDL